MKKTSPRKRAPAACPALCSCSAQDPVVQKLAAAVATAGLAGHGIFAIVRCAKGHEVGYVTSNLDPRETAQLAGVVIGTIARLSDADPPAVALQEIN